MRLRALGVCHTYPGGVRALGGVDVELASGEVLVVIGPNGSGKSTLLRCLAGLLRASAGDITLDGVSVASLPARQRARALAVVPQYLPALPDLKALDFVLGGRYAHTRRFAWRQAGDLALARAALERADAGMWAERSMSELSGGQRQRVLFARALAQEAQLVLFDEPTSSLDPEHQLSAFEGIASLSKGDGASMVVTHDLNLASQFATRVLLLADGKAVATGTVPEILRPSVLEPIYGRRLFFGRIDSGGSSRPFVLPWSGGPVQ